MRRPMMRAARPLVTACAGAVCALASWTIAPIPAHAGVELTTEVSRPAPPADKQSADKQQTDKQQADKQSQQTRSGRMLLDGDRVRMELDGDTATEPKHVMIFRGDRDLMWSLDEKRRTYTEVDRARMQEMRTQSDAARAKMRADLAKLPPAEQARMQAALAASDPGSAPREAPTVKETGRVDTVGGLRCHEVEVSRGGKKESEICVVDWKTAGVTKAELAPVRKLGTFQQETFAGTPARRDSDDMLALFDGLDGLPVRVRSFKGDQVRSEFRVLKVEHKPVDAALFEPPTGFQKRTFSISMPGARPPLGGAPPPNAVAPNAVPGR